VSEDDDLLLMLAARSLNEFLETLKVLRVDLGCLARHRRSVAPVVRSPERGIVVAVPERLQGFSDIVKALFSAEIPTLI
jgi:hypothetical protein